MTVHPATLHVYPLSGERGRAVIRGTTVALRALHRQIGEMLDVPGTDSSERPYNALEHGQYLLQVRRCDTAESWEMAATMPVGGSHG